VAIHPEATGFDLRAREYESGRPTYPLEAVTYLCDELGIGPSSTVVDLAAGTGKLTRALIGQAGRVIAVEPVAGMRQVLSEVVPGATLVDGTAEQVPLPDGSAHAVTVGQAFHWFRGDEALSEIHRLLVPRGRLGLVWNVRDLDQPLQRSLEDVLDRYRGSTPSQASHEWGRAFDRTTLFGPLHHQSFPMAQVTDGDGVVARILSISFVARLAAPEQAVVADQVAALVAPAAGPITLSYVTDVYWCEKIG
jgi:SAM-dependent methyltransferase